MIAEAQLTMLSVDAPMPEADLCDYIRQTVTARQWFDLRVRAAAVGWTLEADQVEGGYYVKRLYAPAIEEGHDHRSR